MRRAAMTVEDGPEAVVNLVIRTRERALLEDGSRPGPVWETAFGTSAPPRSAVCLPLLRQGRLAGVLYLENSQAAYAFTAQRMAVLEVLAAQAAIALENARLYGDLQAREAKIRRLVEANIIGIFVWTLDGRVIEANDALPRPGRIRPRGPAVRANSRLERHDAARMARRRSPGGSTGSGRGHRASPTRRNTCARTAAASRCWWAPPRSAKRREEGVAFVLDLTEQKEAEQRLKLMVDELNHRVKNTLATVMSISAQSLRTATSLDDFREAFQQRLQALSNTHNLLNRTFWTGVSLGDLVQEATAPYATGESGRVVVEGEDVRLGPIAAVTLGMALHELATNAARYGAFSTAVGPRPGRLAAGRAGPFAAGLGGVRRPAGQAAEPARLRLEADRKGSRRRAARRGPPRVPARRRALHHGHGAGAGVRALDTRFRAFGV